MDFWCPSNRFYSPILWPQHGTLTLRRWRGWITISPYLEIWIKRIQDFRIHIWHTWMIFCIFRIFSAHAFYLNSTDLVICDALLNFAPFLQFQKHEGACMKNTHGEVLLLVRLEARFLNCTNGSKLRKAPQIFIICISYSSFHTTAPFLYFRNVQWR